MSNIISREFNFTGLIKFTLPSIITLMFSSVYTIIDGFFISNYVGTDALSAVNIAFPLHSIILSIGIMFGAGGSAIIARNLGEKNNDKASKNLSMISFVSVIIGLIVVIITFIFAKPLLMMLGSNDVILPYALDYYKTLALFLPFSILQLTYINFFVSAGKPQLLLLCIVGGILNIILDYILMVPLNMGIKGAAIATGINFLIPAIGGLIFFFKNKSGLHYKKFKLKKDIIFNAMLNGSSEMVSNLSATVTTTVFNILMMKFIGSNGVAAITVMLYAQFLMTSLFLGFSSGIGPIISYHYGAENKTYLQKVIKMSMKFTIYASIFIVIVANLFAPAISGAFAAGNEEVKELSTIALRLFSVSFIFSGVNILLSGLYTALSNGRVSALLSICRTFVFILLGVAILSSLFSHIGLFLSIPFAEFATVIVSIICYNSLKKYYF